MSTIPVWERYLAFRFSRSTTRSIARPTAGSDTRSPGQAPILLLHTVGAKTGIARTNALSYALDGGSYHVVASKGGDPKPPPGGTST